VTSNNCTSGFPSISGGGIYLPGSGETCNSCSCTCE
jgi:hypothetical protein